MPAAVLVDTGPLVALFDRSDRWHDRCRAELDRLEKDDLVTCEPVITEASYLLDYSVEAQAALQQLLSRGRPRVLPIEQADRSRIAELVRKYSGLPMDYADAALVALAERHGVDRVFTLDFTDFGLYRAGRRKLALIPRQR